MDIDNLIDGYPILMKLREISISIGHPVSCLIEMSILLMFAYLIYHIQKIKKMRTYQLLDSKKMKNQNNKTTEVK